MKTLPEHFTVLQYCGVWLPVEWTSSFKNYLYNVYTLLMVFLYFTFCLSCIIGLFMSINNIDEFLDSGVMPLSFTANCCKYILVLLKRDDIMRTFENIETKLCQPMNDEEKKIQLQINSKARGILKLYTFLVMGTVLTIVVGTVVENIPSRTLPFNVWLPYAHDDHCGYWIAYLHQNIAVACGAMIALTIDTIIYGVMIHICGQLKLLKYRLNNDSQAIYQDEHKNQTNIMMNNYHDWEQMIIKNCVEHHLIILKISDECNNIFSSIIFVQFLVSLLAVAVTIQALSKISYMSPKFMYIAVYLSNVLTQIFFFCWYGNEVVLESADIVNAVYEINWLAFTLKTQRSLLIIVARAFFPIVFTSGHVVTLSIASFNTLLKTSYSAYNLLSQAAQ